MRLKQLGEGGEAPGRGGCDALVKRPRANSDTGAVRGGTSGGLANPLAGKARSCTGAGCWDDAGPADRAAGAASP
eukprot:1787025-Lingulodinium_polyedra.AAC.1